MRVVIDTNVWVSALLTPAGGTGGILVAIDEGELVPVASRRLLEELEDVLHRAKFRRWVSLHEAEDYLARVRDRVELVDDPGEVIPVVRDPDDDYLVALARAAEVDALVSGDDDLLAIEIEDVDVMTPAECLRHLSSGSDIHRT